MISKAQYKRRLPLFISAALILAGLTLYTPAAAQTSNPSSGFGADPALPEPESGLFPTMNIAPAKGWPKGGAPSAAPGLSVAAFANKLNHPRWIYVLPNGDVLVAETDAPPKPDDNNGIKGWITKLVMKKAGSGSDSANRITLLRDQNGDGMPDLRAIFLSNLHSPFGMALIGNNFYVANTNAIMRFPYQNGDTQITAAGTKIADLPGGPLNHHWTKNIIASPDGKYLYASVGSNSNVGENGIDKEENRAAIHQINLATGERKIFASGLRNPVGMDWQPVTGALWTAVNERDELGDNLVPDYMTSVQEDGFYGWPYSYYGQHIDTRVEPQKPNLVAQAIKPDYALGAHTASLGLVFYDDALLPAQYHGGAFIGQHGSWNRSVPAGYKVIYVPFINGKPSGLPQDVLTGFLSEDGDALGRPVGVAIDGQGALLVADDVGNMIWRVTPAQAAAIP